jgi:hypothetical protein
MAIYGYERDDEEATKPMLLSEATFQFSPADLRRIASFLVARAEEIEGGVFTDGGRHLRSYDKTWNVKDAGDVIVVPLPAGDSKIG